MYQLPPALLPLGEHRQFIVWREVPHPVIPGKVIKKPVDHRTLRVHNPHDPEIWTDPVTAAVVCLGHTDLHVGFVFTANDPFFFLDIDGAFDGVNWSQASTDLCAQFAGAAIEVSVSGKGLHIFGTGACPEHSCKNIPAALELYTDQRFVALGLPETATGTAALDCSAQLTPLVEQYFTASQGTGPVEWTNTPRSDWNGPADDTALIEQMCGVKNAFGEVISDAGKIWAADAVYLALRWPDETRPHDASSADAALASHLAFWTGCNCERMLQLMRRSGLVREKWDKHKKYLQMTIENACAFQKDVYSSKVKPEAEPLHEVAEVVVDSRHKSGYQFLSVSDQIKHFKGCTYVAACNRVLMPNGMKLKPETFKATMSAGDFQFDNSNGPTKSNAFDVFTQSNAYDFPRADTVCFRPDLPHGEIVDVGAVKAVNEYLPPNTKSVKGDVTRFLDHVAKLLPDTQDQAIILAYMAAIVQHKGVKFQWATLLQGAPGNGKTLLSNCVEQAIGSMYAHWPNADNISNKFNSWMYGNILIAVEDIQLGTNQWDVIERLKPMITNTQTSVERKGVDSETVNVCCNFMFNSNHKDAIKVDGNDRRFSIFYTAQQSAEDIIRDGMGGDYFTNLWDWLRDEGFAYVTEFLTNYSIPDQLNPGAACSRAPKTSTTHQVIEQSFGLVEQEILEAVESCRKNFCGGWISSTGIILLLKELRRNISPQKRKDVMMCLGYVPHPSLRGGRVEVNISTDVGHPILYVKESNTILMGLNADDAVHNYITAQLAVSGPGEGRQIFGS